jgi:hypothetical protein
MSVNVIELAEQLLTETTGHPVRLINPQKLSDVNTVLRCSLEPTQSNMPLSVILKQVTTTEFNNPDGLAGESHRFLNEWASLSFLSKLHEKSHFGPKLLASDRESNLIILEDFGKHQTVEDILLGNHREKAEKGLRAIGTFLGQMHAAAYGRGEFFVKEQTSLNASSPQSDSTFDFSTPPMVEIFQDCLSTLQITPATGFWDALHKLEKSIHSPGPFYTFIHADAGPHNYLYFGETVQLIDYEFGVLGYGLLDVVSARLGFPHSALCQSVPGEIVQQLERAYQKELAIALPQITDQIFFEQELVNACAHWALSRWGLAWMYYFKRCFEIDDEKTINEEMELTTGQAQKRRSRLMTLYQSFIQFAYETDHQLPIADTLQLFTLMLQQKWPELNVMPVYPALQD